MLSCIFIFYVLKNKIYFLIFFCVRTSERVTQLLQKLRRNEIVYEISFTELQDLKNDL